MSETTETEERTAGPARKSEGWVDLALTVIIALAAVGTAWAGFQSAKWSGLQAISFAEASAMRTESTRQSTTAGQLLTIDVATFTAWLNAVDRERAGEFKEGYRPDPKTLSGVLYNRFRPEFKPAVDAWLATKPLINPAAPPTPFAMPEYKRGAQDKADTLLTEAEQAAEEARTSNQRSDNYVLTAVLFALVLFFAALTGRAGRRNKQILFAVTSIAFMASVVLLVTYPVAL